jgi:GNAT superfamily N-acetyltransferase
MSVIIRKAIQKDCSAILELVKELAIYEKAPNEVTVDLQHFTESGFGATPVWWCWVAEVNGNIVGFALYYIRFSTWKGQRMYLEDLLVTNEFRGKGIGKLLMNAIIMEAQEKKFDAICWQVLDWNEPAINFYKKYNAFFDPEWLNVSIKIN